MEEERVRYVIGRQETLIPQDKFLFVFTPSQLKEGCCCCCSLKTGILIFCALDAIAGICSLFSLPFKIQDWSGKHFAENIIDIIQIIGLWFCIHAYKSAVNYIPERGRIYYLWKIFYFAMIILSMLYQSIYEWNYPTGTQIQPHIGAIGYFMIIGILLFIMAIICDYLLLVMYSFYNLLFLGEVILVTNGRDVAEMIRKLQAQNAPIQLT